MAGRNHLPPPARALRLREVNLSRMPLPPPLHPLDDHRLHNRVLLSAADRLPHPSTILDNRIAIQQREVQSLLIDNQRLAGTHIALKQDLAIAQQDIRQLSAAAADVKAERDDRVRQMYEKSLKLDAEVRGIGAMSEEIVQVKTDVKKLTILRQELTAELQAINDDLDNATREAKQVREIKAEINAVKHEIQRGRAAIEIEKKTRVSNLEHRRVMEKNMIMVANEIEILCAELNNAEKRARAAATAAAAGKPSHGYAANHGNLDVGYGVNPYPDLYGVHQVQVQAGGDAGRPFASGGMPNNSYDMQPTRPHR